MFDKLIGYVVGKGVDMVDSTYQRAFKNWRTSAWGGVWTGVFEAVLSGLETQGCNLASLKPAGLLFLGYGAWQTEKNKVIIRNGDGRLTTKTAEQLIQANPADFTRPDTGNN